MDLLWPAARTDAEPYDFYRRPDPRTPWLRVNMISSLDGEITDSEGRAGGLAGPGDRAAFRAQRAQADAILVGAGTARTEGYGPHRLHPSVAARRRADGWTGPAAIVVVSLTLDLDPSSRLFTEAETPTIVLTASASPARRRRDLEAVAEVIVAGERRVDFAAGMAALRAEGLNAILCEGGPHLNRSLFEAGLPDELCLTIAPTVRACDLTRLVAPSPAAAVSGLELAGIAREGDELFLRYLLPRDT